jgi:glycosyltransferase involved in cell wall biosynthesis
MFLSFALIILQFFRKVLKSSGLHCFQPLTMARRVYTSSNKMAPALSKIQSGKLRIAIVAPMYYTIPPKNYGGTERVVHYLIQDLAGMGHTVTLYGATGCNTDAELIECAPITLSEAGMGCTIEDMKGPYTLQLKRLLADLTRYDIVHVHQGVFDFHCDIFTKPGPYVWTDHCLYTVENKPDCLKYLHEHAKAGITSISESQRDTLAGEKYWMATVYNGIPKYLLAPMNSIKPEYLGFLGRLAPEKGVPEAVKVSIMSGYKLHVAAKLEDIHQGYYKKVIKPLFDRHDVTFKGEINDGQKSEFLSGAVALIFPICWREPFGLVMIEAMACGTPVVAYDAGAVREVIEEGVTGYVVKNAEEAAARVKDAVKLDRKRVREEFEKRFTSQSTAEGYLDVYHRIIAGEVGRSTQAETVAQAAGIEADDNDTNEHVCPGHRRCSEVIAKHICPGHDSCHTGGRKGSTASQALDVGDGVGVFNGTTNGTNGFNGHLDTPPALAANAVADDIVDSFAGLTTSDSRRHRLN